jgi:hypothetical protein
MREQSGVAGFSRVHWVLPVCLLAVGCGASTDGGGAGGAGVLTESPHCPAGTRALIIEGSIDGGAIEDSRGADSNAGYVNIGTPKFDTPVSDFVPLESNQLVLTITWKDGLFDGQTGAITSGSLTLPSTHPSAGAQFCVTRGEVGFVDGGAEDAAFKFAISEVKAGADCSGAMSAVDLRGCYNN